MACNTSFAALCFKNQQHTQFTSEIGFNVNDDELSKALLPLLTGGRHAIVEISDTAANSAQATRLFSDKNIVSAMLIGIHDSNGLLAGVLCLADTSANELVESQRAVVRYLAKKAEAVLPPLLNNVASAVQKIKHQDDNALLDTLRSEFIVSVTDTTGVIIEVNDAFCAISKYSRAELLGQNHRLVNSNTHSKDFFSQMWETVRRNTSWHGEICNRAKDGSLYWVDSVIAPLSDVDGNIDRYISIRSDITARKAQENALHKNESLLNRTGRLAGVGGWEVSLKDQSLYWSEETCRIHGLEPDYQPDLESAINFYAPEARPIVSAAVENAIATGDSWDLELPLIKNDGVHIWVRAVGSVEYEDGEAVRLIGAFQDITQRVIQSALVDEAHSRMELATNSGEIGVWELDLETQKLTWNEWMFRLYGLAPHSEQENYELWSSIIHPDDKHATEVAIDKAIAGIEAFDTDFRVKWKDGSVHFIRAAARITFDAQGKPSKMIGVNWDVSDVVESNRQLSEQRELLEVTLESIGDAVITTDALGQTTWLNPVAQHLTGWQNKDAIGRPLSHVFNIVNEDTRLKTENPIETCLAQGRVVGLANHTILISKNGDEYGIEDSAAPIRNASGEVLGAVLVFHDVTEQRRLSNEVTHQATHDSLTGLVNRLEFETRLRRLLRQSVDEDNVHALLYVDLDQFKIVNDTCGHTVGDKMLQQIGSLLDGIIRTRDTLARLGGDEFGVILERCSAKQAMRVAELICKTMDEFRFIHEEHRFRIGASIGLVPIDERWATTSELMQAADKSCYAAKDAGRNRVHLWSESDLAMRTRHGEMQWTTRIEKALDDKRFELYAQRLVCLEGGDSGNHAEVLVRMRDEDGSIVLPGAFFPAAERFHLASRIDRWVLRHAIDWLNEQSKEVFERIDMLCINLSGQSVGDRAFHEFATEIFNEIEPRTCAKICLEITETAAITNINDASLFIEQVSELGVLVALDDFGAGASSFDYLKKLSVDILKIDGQFIQDLIDDPLDEAAVRCFVEVAKIVNLRTVAEFVDSPAVLERVKHLGINYAQGFLLHKPEPIDVAIGSGAML